MLTSAGVPPDMSTFFSDYFKWVVLPWATGFLIMTHCRFQDRRRARVYKSSSYL